MNRIKSKLILFTGTISLLLINYSCCTKTYCDSTGNRIYSITFNSFNNDEIDTVRIIKFERNTNFSVAIDSNEYYNTNYYYNYFYEINLPEGLKVEYDYVIRTGYKSYKVSDFLFKRFKCSSCFPFAMHNDYYYDLDSYVLDGNKTYGNTIYLNKYDNQ